MLRLSRMTDYGTVIMAQMAAKPWDVSSAAEIAAATGLTPTTASKILKTLTRHGLLRSARGVTGGYALALPPERISLADVIAAMEGTVAMTECGVRAGICPQEAHCPSRDQWRRLNVMVRGVLAGVTLADMNRPLPAAAPPAEKGS